jgi:hypothetical protein
MEVGQAALKVVARLRDEEAPEASLPVCAAPSSAAKPAIVDRAVSAIVRRLPVGPVRDPDERVLVAKRHAELVGGLQPHREEDDVALALTDLVDSVPAKRMGEAATAARVKSLLELFCEFPGWAIKQACRNIRLGTAEIWEEGSGSHPGRMRRLPVSYAVTDAEIAEVIERLVALYRREREELVGLLARPLDPPKLAAAEPAHDEHVAAGLKALSGHMALIARAQEIADAIAAEQSREQYRNHAARVAADLAERRARNESRAHA